MEVDVTSVTKIELVCQFIKRCLYSVSLFALCLLLLPARSKRGTCYGNVAGWLAGSVTAGIVSKRLNLS